MSDQEEVADQHARTRPNVPILLTVAISLDTAVVVCSTLTIMGIVTPAPPLLEGTFRFAGQALPLLTLAASIQFVRARDIPLRERLFAAAFLAAANLLAWLGAAWAMTANITEYA